MPKSDQYLEEIQRMEWEGGVVMEYPLKPKLSWWQKLLNKLKRLKFYSVF